MGDSRTGGSGGSCGEAARRWATALDRRTIPEDVLRAAPANPWGFPRELFRARADAAASGKPTVSDRRALDVLARGGTVLDVGCGAGASSIALARRASLVTGVDASRELLESFANVFSATDARVETIEGTWPQVADTTPVHDVVVCHHVAYNVPDIVPFLDALTTHARTRVVVELTAEHPLAWMGDLWRTFHDVEMPPGPTADDLASVLTEHGIEAERAERDRTPDGGLEERTLAIALVRRRLCLPSNRDGDVASALGPRLAEHHGRWSAGPERQRLVTFWWPGTAD